MRGPAYVHAAPPGKVRAVKREIPKILRALNLPEFISKGNVDFELRARGITIEGHLQYFSRILDEGIKEARIPLQGIIWRYIPWSNVHLGNRYRSYKKVQA